LIDKYFSGPLWRLIASKKHVLEMNTVYQEILEHFELFASDASPILLNNFSAFPDQTNNIAEDVVFQKLLEINDSYKDSIIVFRVDFC